MSARASCPLEEAGELPREGEADLRYRGQSFELTVPLGPDLAERFHAAHEERYGYADRHARSSSSPCGRPRCGPGPELELRRADSHEVAGPGARRPARGDLLGAGGLARAHRRLRDARPGAA